MVVRVRQELKEQKVVCLVLAHLVQKEIVDLLVNREVPDVMVC